MRRGGEKRRGEKRRQEKRREEEVEKVDAVKGLQERAVGSLKAKLAKVHRDSRSRK